MLGLCLRRNSGSKLLLFKCLNISAHLKVYLFKCNRAHAKMEFLKRTQRKYFRVLSTDQCFSDPLLFEVFATVSQLLGMYCMHQTNKNQINIKNHCTRIKNNFYLKCYIFNLKFDLATLGRIKWSRSQIRGPFPKGLKNFPIAL